MKYIALDLETASLRARYDPTVDIYCIAFAYVKDSADEYSDNDVTTECYIWNDYAKQRLLDYMKDESVIFVIHNASFDVAVLRCHGIDISPGKYVDSMLCAYVLQPGREVNLDALSAPLGYPKLDFKGELVKAGVIDSKAKQGEVFSIDYTKNKEALDTLLRYCIRDAEAALVVWSFYSNLLHKDEKLSQAYYNLELPYVECIIDMEQTGLYIDTSKLSKLKQNLEKRIVCLNEVTRKLVSLVPADIKYTEDGWFDTGTEYKRGYSKHKNNIKYYTDSDGNVLSSEPHVIYPHCHYTEFNPNSARHVAWVLITQGWTPTQFSKKTGQPNVNEEVIEEIKNDYPFSRVYSTYQTYNKLLNTFVKGIQQALDIHGYAHGSFNQCQTKTTRLSSSSPNLQNLPARTALGAKVRECVTCPQGYTLLVADLDQIEIRVLAYYLEKSEGETRMAEGARQKLDAHQVNSQSWNVSRRVAKTGIFACNYGASAELIAKKLKIPLSEAEAILETINKEMPAIASLKRKVWSVLSKHREGVYLKDAKNLLRNDGVIYSLFGSRLVYHDYNHHWKGMRERVQRQTFNALIQGSAANINKELSVRIMPILKQYRGHMVATVHDEVLVYVPTGHALTVKHLLNEVYNDNEILKHETNYVPVTGEWNEGRNWLEAKHG